MASQGLPTGNHQGTRADTPIVAARLRVPVTTALARERIETRLAQIWRHRVGFVVAPAGSGKTTLLASFAATTAADGIPVAWYRAEARDAAEPAFLRYLEAAVGLVVGGLPGPWSTVDDALASLEEGLAAQDVGRCLLVIDDLHTLDSTSAEAALEALIANAPPALTVLAGTRTPPALNRSRLRVSGDLVEIDADELRFRIWEVERLFRDFYGSRFGPEELATVTRRTAGWAAGLQLFHLATSGKPPDEQRRILAGMSSSARVLREYLTWNVLDQLPADLRQFLVDTSVLPLLSGALCDAFLGRSGSAAHLRELERRQVFTIPLDDEGSYRYHEVLRTTLEALYRERHGEDALGEAHRRAGEVLLAAAALPEALTAFCRGGAWEVAERLIREAGPDLVDRPGQSWLDAIPVHVLRQDPWLVLATARQHRAEGRWAASVEAYERAETAFASNGAAAECRRERQAISVWLTPGAGLGRDWSSMLRAAAARDPQAVAKAAAAAGDGSGDVTAGLVPGIALLLAGRVREARTVLLRAADGGDEQRRVTEPGAFRVAALIGAGVAGLLANEPRSAVDLQSAIGEAEQAALGWLSRIARVALLLTDGPEGRSQAGALRTAFARAGDEWSAALVGLLGAWFDGDNPGAPVATDLDETDLDATADSFRRLGAGTLEAWARALVAFRTAQNDGPHSRELLRAADATARATATPAARLLVASSLELLEPDRASAHRALARAMVAETGLAVPSQRGGREAIGTVAPPMSASSPSATIRLFGGFVMELHGAPVNLASVKPRARAVLRLLAANAGTLVHREAIQAAFWPDAAPATASRLLQVAISSLRRALEPGAARGSAGLIVREGDAYRLALPRDADVDRLAFEAAIAAGRAARLRGERPAAVAAFSRALERYIGDLLPEDGPADWLIPLRDRCRMAAAEAAEALAELHLADGNALDAIHACTAGLRVDRFHDPLWRLLIDAHAAAGDRGAAAQAQRGYDQMLAELGV